MAGKKVAARNQMPDQLLKNADLCRPVKINNDVPAENNFGRLADAIV